MEVSASGAGEGDLPQIQVLAAELQGIVNEKNLSAKNKQFQIRTPFQKLERKKLASISLKAFKIKKQEFKPTKDSRDILYRDENYKDLELPQILKNNVKFMNQIRHQ